MNKKKIGVILLILVLIGGIAFGIIYFKTKQDFLKETKNYENAVKHFTDKSHSSLVKISDKEYRFIGSGGTCMVGAMEVLGVPAVACENVSSIWKLTLTDQTIIYVANENDLSSNMPYENVSSAQKVTTTEKGVWKDNESLANYASFDCKKVGVCDTYRILGVFDGHLKLIRIEDEIQAYSNCTSNCSNQWSTETVRTYLNGQFYDLLDGKAKEMVIETPIYEGVVNKNIAVDTEDEEHKMTSNLKSKVSLMYLSDYQYASANYQTCKGLECNFHNWIMDSNYHFEDYWTMTRAIDYNNGGNYVVGKTNGMSQIKNGNYIRPVVTLNEKVTIQKGDGTITNPYVFYFSES